VAIVGIFPVGFHARIKRGAVRGVARQSR
jgi:hypothetical protein